MRHLCLVAACLIVAQATWADVVRTFDGRVLEGTVKRVRGGWEIADFSGGKTTVLDEDVNAVEKTPAPDAMDLERLASVRRFADRQDDLAVIIARYEWLLKQKPGSGVRARAEEDLSQWRELKSSSAVKLGGKWLTLEQRREMLTELLPLIEEARNLVKQGNLKAAEPAVRKLLQKDPQDAAGQYLNGILAFRQGRMAEASAAWTVVNGQVTDHGPTLNNLGAAAFMAGNYAAATGFFDQALARLPDQQMVLDNLAEALAATPVAQRDVAYQAAAARFQQQDGALAEKMKAKELFRWGSQWMKAEEIERIQAANKEVDSHLEALNQEITNLRQRLEQVDIDLESTLRQRYLRDNRSSYVRSYLSSGLLGSTSSGYSQGQRDISLLQSEKLGMLRRFSALEAQAAAVEAQRPMSGFTGRVGIIGAEATPLAPPGGGPLLAAEPAR